MEKRSCYIVIGMGMIFSGLLILFYIFMPSSATVYRQTENSVQADTETEQIRSKIVLDESEETTAIEIITTTTKAQVYPINLNTATAKDLSDNISGIGDVIASRIIEYRENHGPFSSVDELINVSGIGEKKLSAIRNYVTVD